MFLALTASSDTYITNKIINGSYRAIASNVGRAGTLDLFKLYDESSLLDAAGLVVTSSVYEKTRVLMKFDLDYIAGLTGSICDVNATGFRAYLQLFDIMSGLPVPNDFSIVANPLSRSFDEGRGRDVSQFSDLDSCNYITSSYSDGSNVLWNTEGCDAGGGLAYVAASGNITVDDAALAGTIILSDGSKTVTFSSNAASTSAVKTDATNYTYGTSGVGSINVGASRVFDAIALAKTNSDLAITATDPAGASAIVLLTQDNIGPTGDTSITGTAIDNGIAVADFKNGYDPSSLDYFTSGSVAGVTYDFGASQTFINGTEDASIDVTTAVSASLAGLIPNRGFRISFSGSFDTDQKTWFAKRFASRHSKNELKIPRLFVTFDSHIDDSHPKMILNEQVNLFLTNKVNGKLANIRSGSEPGTPAGTIHPLTGTDCLKVTLSSGSVIKSYDASQYLEGTNSSQKTGTYFVSLLLNRFDSDFFASSNKQASLTFNEVWSSSDLTVPYYSGTLDVKTNHADGDTPVPDDILVNPIGHKQIYYTDEDVTVRFFMEDLKKTQNEKPYKLPRSRKTMVVSDVHYCIKDEQTSQVLVPFDTARGSTKLSTDSNGMYMIFKPEGLPTGRSLIVDLLFDLEGNSRVISLPEFKFRVKKR